jgi:hypothetical protein
MGGISCGEAPMSTDYLPRDIRGSTISWMDDLQAKRGRTPPDLVKQKEEKISYGMNALLNMNAPESQKRQKTFIPPNALLSRSNVAARGQ